MFMTIVQMCVCVNVYLDEIMYARLDEIMYAHSRRDFNNDADSLYSWDHCTNQNPHKILLL